jgi:hypothetical protein
VIMFILLVSLMQPVDDWLLSCAQYQALVLRLYSDPYFETSENLGRRQEIHDILKSRTFDECIEVNA